MIANVRSSTRGQLACAIVSSMECCQHNINTTIFGGTILDSGLQGSVRVYTLSKTTLLSGWSGEEQFYFRMCLFDSGQSDDCHVIIPYFFLYSSRLCCLVSAQLVLCGTLINGKCLYILRGVIEYRHLSPRTYITSITNFIYFFPFLPSFLLPTQET